jgi:diaminopimelate decarboxylase
MDHETPFFLIDGDVLAARLTELSRLTSPSILSYSVKTLPVAEALLEAVTAGWLVEVVSQDEFSFARQLGVAGASIVVNGPSKSDALLLEALRSGAIVNVDSEEELHRAAQLADQTPSWRVGVRLGLGVSDPQWARFGVDATDTGDCIKRICKATTGRRILGFHVHSGTARASLQEFLLISARAVDFASSYAHVSGDSIEWVDLGGGFADVTLPPAGYKTWNPPSLNEFVNGAASLLRAWNGPPPRLIFEPGRAVVGPLVDLHASVETTKSVAGVQVVTLDAGVNILPFARYHRHVIETGVRQSEPLIQSVLCGPLCMSDDFVSTDVDLPKLKRGDVVTIRGVGAYNISMSFDFIRPRAPVYFHRMGKDVRTQPWLKSPPPDQLSG